MRARSLFAFMSTVSFLYSLNLSMGKTDRLYKEPELNLLTCACLYHFVGSAGARRSGGSDALQGRSIPGLGMRDSFIVTT